MAEHETERLASVSDAVLEATAEIRELEVRRRSLAPDSAERQELTREIERRTSRLSDLASAERHWASRAPAGETESVEDVSGRDRP